MTKSDNEPRGGGLAAAGVGIPAKPPDERVAKEGGAGVLKIGFLLGDIVGGGDAVGAKETPAKGLDFLAAGAEEAAAVAKDAFFSLQQMYMMRTGINVHKTLTTNTQTYAETLIILRLFITSSEAR